MMSQLVGHGFSVSWPCNSWCTAALFYYLLNTTQAHNLATTLLKKGTAAVLPPKASQKSLHLPSFHSKMEEQIQQLIFCATALRMNAILYSADVEFNNVICVITR